ncbi:PKD domain-containing protein [Paenibacillus ginsengarvi]
MIPGLRSKAWAAGETTDTAALDYEGKANWQFYSVEQNLTPSVTIDFVAGKKIQKVEYIDGDGTMKTIAEAVGKPSWSGSIPTKGKSFDVLSKNNSHTLTYFAWYRYSNTSAKKGWYAKQPDEFGGEEEVYCESGPTESIGGVSMPIFPSCSATVVFGATRDKGYYRTDDSSYVDDNYVTVTGFSNPTVQDNQTNITGPEGTFGTSEGPSSTNPISNAQLLQVGSGFKIKYNQTFNDYPNDGQAPPSSAIKDLAMPGARLMVYFGSFAFDIYGKTYLHPSHITVTYEDNLVPEPDVSDLKVVPAACIEVGKNMSFYVSFTNYGAAYSGPFNLKVTVDGTVIETIPFSGFAAGETKKGEFLYKFTAAESKTFVVTVDSLPGEKNTADNSKSFSFTAKTSCSGGGDPDPGGNDGPEVITGDFKFFYPNSMTYGQAQVYLPENVTVKGTKNGNTCTLAQLLWTSTQGSKVYKDNAGANVYAGGLSGPPYPAGIGGGRVDVTMQITTSCETVKVVGPKSFEIIVPTDNLPPVFRPGWFAGGNSFGFPEITEVIVGSYVDLGIVHDITQNPPTPYDPDGDGIIYYFDFKNSPSAWIRQLKVDRDFWEYDEHYRLIKADVLGTHQIQVCAQDTRGADAGCKFASLNVVSPDPIPVITGGDGAIEGRPIPQPFSCANSYTPFKDRTISNCIWGGDKRDMYPVTGYYTVTLDVVDSGGLHSRPEAQASKTIFVKPDLPPVVSVSYPSAGIRGVPMTFIDSSFSPDGDVIVQHSDVIRCDTNLNGSYDGPAYNVTPDGSGMFTFSAPIVGSCKLSVFVKEDWGKSASKDFYFSISNQAPTVQASIFGEQPQPPDVDVTNYNLQDMVINRSLYSVEDHYSQNRDTDMYFNAAEGALAVPDRPMLYRAPDPNSMSIGATIPPSGGLNISEAITHRVGRNFWAGYGFNHMMCTGACVPYGYKLQLYDIRSNTIKTMSDSNSKKIYEIQFNSTSEMLWLRSYASPEGMCNGSYMGCSTGDKNVTDNYYRLSDVAAGNFTPFYTEVKPVQQWLSPYQYAQYMLPSNPPPGNWVDDSGIQEEPANVPYNFDVNGTRSTKPYISQTRDRQGNFYALACTSYEYQIGWEDDGNAWMVTVYNCFLQKLSSNGTVIWTNYAKTYTNLYNTPSRIEHKEYPMLRIAYISEDNSKLITTDGIYDNNTGTYLGQLYQKDFSGYNGIESYTCFPSCATPAEWTNGYGGMNFKNNYNEVIYYYYWTSYQDDGCESDCTTYYIYHHVLYNLKTLQAVMEITTPPFGDGVYEFTPTGTLAADGKFILPVSSGTANVYDVMTGQNLYTMSLPPATNNYRPIGDGKGFAIIPSGNKVTTSNLSANTTYDAGRFSFGTLVDRYKDFYDGSISLSVRFYKNSFSEYNGAGVAFREQDHRNKFEAELTTEGVILSKIVNGTKTILGKQTNPLLAGQYANLKVTAKRDHILVYVNGVPLIDVYDGSYSSGKVGLFSNVPNVYMKNFRTESYKAASEDVAGIVIVGTTIKYSSTYTDPENDPSIPDLREWIYTNTAPEKFLNAGDGYSDSNAANSYINYKLTGTLPVLNKVGLYKIDYSEVDDPAPLGYQYPNWLYQSFRKRSDPAVNYVIVHRRPIASFTISQNPDYTFAWNDTSYDPDRWLAPWHYSTEPTGIDYAATRGVVERRYGYTDPDGSTQYGKLTRPAKSGTYTVRLSVKDEYGAWSDWAEQTVTVTMPFPNTPPTVALTFPNGTEANPSFIDTVRPVIKWNQYDSDPGTTFAAYRVIVKDEWGNVLRDSGIKPQNTTLNYAEWQLDTSLTPGQKYQVQVQVSDGIDWSGWSNIGWMIVNSPPKAVLTFPNGLSAEAANLVQDNRRPGISWNQYDPDLAYGGVFQQYRVQIMQEDGTLVYDYSTAQWTQATSQSMTPTSDLPNGIPLQVHVQVFDGFVWSDWSNIGWLRINMTPIADVTYPSGTQANPTIEGPTPTTITWNQWDVDPGTVFLKYQLHIVNEANTTIVYDSGEASQYTSATTQSHLVAMALPAGQKLRVRVRVFDGYVWSPWSGDKWLLTNRPPVADFDWMPKPIWEGDTVYLDNLSTDPDGDALTSVWEIRLPDGQVRTYGTTDATQLFPEPGSYTVTLTVSDGFAISRVTKVLEALPLTITSEVHHTPQWRAIHEQKGHNTTTVPKDFYSGEIFVVRTFSSPAPVSEAKAWIETTGIDGNALAASILLDMSGDDLTRFDGKLFDDKFMSATEGIPEGILPIHFQIRYANGVVKREDVPVRIIGNINEAVEVHRRQ